MQASVLSLAILLALPVDAWQKCPCRYLDPRKVERLNTYDEVRDHRVTCYDRGMHWVCPNPQKAELTREIEGQYDFGFFVGKRDYFLSDKDFFHCAICDSPMPCVEEL